MIHNKPSELAGKIVKIKKDATHFQLDNFGGSDFRVEDWWDRVTGRSWMIANGNPAAIIYAMRSSHQIRAIPTDDEVLYGKIGSLGHLVHISEIEDAEEN